MEAAMADQHKTKVTRADDATFVHMYGGAFDASCSCGWTERRTTKARAQASADACARAFVVRRSVQPHEQDASNAPPYMCTNVASSARVTFVLCWSAIAASIQICRK